MADAWQSAVMAAVKPGTTRQDRCHEVTVMARS
jgi:hypothetical protein